MTGRDHLFFAIPLLFLAYIPLAQAENQEGDDEETPRVILPADFKKCAIKFFENSTEVTEVFEGCESEMNAYIESLQPLDSSSSIAGVDAVMLGTSPESSKQAELATAYENCVVSAFDVTRSEQEALKTCESRLAAYLSTIVVELREKVSRLVLAAVHKALARRSLGEEG